MWAGVTALVMLGLFRKNVGPIGFAFPREASFYRTLAVAIVAPWVYQVLPGIILVTVYGETPVGWWTTLGGAPSVLS